MKTNCFSFPAIVVRWKFNSKFVNGRKWECYSSSNQPPLVFCLNTFVFQRAICIINLLQVWMTASASESWEEKLPFTAKQHRVDEDEVGNTRATASISAKRLSTVQPTSQQALWQFPLMVAN